jgi:hypothetical protein
VLREVVRMAWHARGQGFKSPQLHPRSEAQSGLSRSRIARLGQQIGSNLCCQAGPVVRRGGAAGQHRWRRRPADRGPPRPRSAAQYGKVDGSQTGELTSSLSRIDGWAPCYPAFSQVVRDRKWLQGWGEWKAPDHAQPITHHVRPCLVRRRSRKETGRGRKVLGCK